ncbi:glycosyltransferase [Arcobacter aquimarinus]|uniref:glycosyltransferase n=1 Tax=Arcobacter aquimarinus TaxID=1315211 RepID=UPI003BAFE826
MNQNKPLLSVAIPTKNRQYYCIEVIKHILSYDNKNFELVIQDNSDDRTIEQFVSTIEDKRLKYVYTNEAISSVENMSRSIALTSGEYVCMIGDDDTILPTIFEYVKYMKENDIDSLCPGYIPSYIWPNKKTSDKGTLSVRKYKNRKKYDEIDAIKRVERLFQDGLIQYQRYNLPRVYHGIIKRMVMDNIYNKIGSYFGGLSPDIYSTVALSSLIKKHVLVNDMFTIAGICPQSTTSQSMLGGHRGELRDAPHLKNKEDYEWDILVPRYYSVETIWAETAIKAARDFGMNKILEKFNIEIFNKKSFFFNRGIKDLVINEYLINRKKVNNKYNRLVFIIGAYYHGLLNISKRIYDKLFLENTKQSKNLVDISIAAKKIDKLL